MLDPSINKDQFFDADWWDVYATHRVEFDILSNSVPLIEVDDVIVWTMKQKSSSRKKKRSEMSSCYTESMEMIIDITTSYGEGYLAM